MPTKYTGGSVTIDNGAVYPTVSPKATVVAKTADYTVLAADMGKIFTNSGASGTVVLTLPSAASVRGNVVGGAVLAAQIVRFLPQTGERIYLNGSGVASKYLNLPATIGVFAALYSDGTDWVVTQGNGVLTKEA